MAGVVQRSAPVLLRNDAGLLRGIRDGDDAAFSELVRRHGSAMRRVCARIVGPDDADDAHQQALMSAARAVREGVTVTDAGRWLHRVAHNASIDWLRRRPAAGEPLDEGIDGVPQPPDVALGRAALAATVAAIQQLPDAQRRALLLSVFEDRSWEEIARELGTGEGAVRGLLHRARTQVRSAAALAVMPYFAVRPRLAHAAALLGRGGEGAGAMKAGAAAVVLGVAAGGGAVVLHHRAPDSHAVPPPVLAAVDPSGPAPRAMVSARLPRHASHDPRRHAGGRHHATLRGVPVSGGRGGSTGHGSPALAATPAPAPASDPPARHHDPARAPAPADPGPAPKPAPAPSPPPTTATTAAPDPPPAATPPPPPLPAAPATMGRVDSFAPYGNGGTLGVALDAGGMVVAFVGEHTVVTCDTVSDGRLVSRSTCTPASIAVGRRIVRADHEANATSGSEVFTAVELVLGA